MKILNLEQFLALPAGVVYTKFQPCLFEDLAVKGETIPPLTFENPKYNTLGDWYYQDFIELDVEGSGEWADKLFEGMEKDISIPLDFDTGGRDGMFDKDQLFAVFEKEDVYGLIRMLKNLVPSYPEITKEPVVKKEEKVEDKPFSEGTYQIKYEWVKGEEHGNK